MEPEKLVKNSAPQQLSAGRFGWLQQIGLMLFAAIVVWTVVRWAGDSNVLPEKIQPVMTAPAVYFDETDLMGIRGDAWKMHIGVKREGSWWNEKYYPSVPHLFNLLMDPLEKMDPESHEFPPAGQRFFARKMWTLNGAVPFIGAHLTSLEEFPPS